MRSHLAPFFQSLTGDYFSPVVGLFYICAKLLIRHILHKFADAIYDFWGTMAWFGVDIILLSSSISIALQVPEKLHLNYHASVYFYLTILVCFLGTCAFYTFFMKRRRSLEGIRPYCDVRLFLYISTIWLLGFASFWAIVDSLKA